MCQKFIRVFIFSFIAIYCASSYASSDTREKETSSTGIGIGIGDGHQVPKRIVTLFQGATDSVIALGIQPVGVVDSWAEQPTYRYLRTALNGVAHVGLETQPNLEKIASLHPDLIIGAQSRHGKIYSQLTQIAPTVMTKNVYDFHQTLALTAKAVGREAQGNQLWKQWQERIIHFRAALQHQVAHWPLTASVIDVRADHLRLYLQDSFPGAVLKDIGFHFPMHGRSGWGVKLKTKEALPSLNADVFFVMLHSNDAVVKQNYQRWRSHPLWKLLNAPKRNQVYPVNGTIWLLSGGILGANLMLDQLSDLYHLAPLPVVSAMVLPAMLLPAMALPAMSVVPSPRVPPSPNHVLTD